MPKTLLQGEKYSLRKMLEGGEQVLSVCVWDNMSLRMAHVGGFRSALISGGTFSEDIIWLPDIGIMTQDNLVHGMERMADSTPLPIVVDADDGYGESPLHAFRMCQRLINAGAAGFSIDDTTGIRGFYRWGEQMRNGDSKINHEVVSRKNYLAKIKASLDACEGTDAILFARTEAKLKYGLDEAIEKCLLARELGAEMTMIIGITNMEEAEYIGKYVPGWKMWPDVMSRDGIPDVNLDDIHKLGFNYVTCHVLERGAMAGMLDMARHTVQDRNTVYHDQFMVNYSEDERESMNYFNAKIKKMFSDEAGYYQVKDER